MPRKPMSQAQKDHLSALGKKREREKAERGRATLKKLHTLAKEIQLRTGGAYRECFAQAQTEYYKSRHADTSR